MLPADFFGSLPMERRQQMSLSESASNPYSIYAVAPDNTPDHLPLRHKKTAPAVLFIKQLRWLVTSLAQLDSDNCALLSWRKAEGCLGGVDAFTFHDTKACEEQISVFFSTNKWDSLKRQLNNYGFLRLHDNRARGSTWFHPHFTQERTNDELIFKKPSAKKMRHLSSLQTLSRIPGTKRIAQPLTSSYNSNDASSQKEAAQESSSLFESLGALADAAEVISCHGAADIGGGSGGGGGVRDLSVEKSRGDGISIAREVTSSNEDLMKPESTDDEFFASKDKKRSWGADSINETVQKSRGIDYRDGNDAEKKKPKFKINVQSQEAFEVDNKKSKLLLDVCPSLLMPRTPSCHAVNLAGPGPISSSRQQHRHAQNPHQGPQKQVHAVQFPIQQPIHDASAGGGFVGGHPKVVYASDRVHKALQPQPQMPQPRLFQQQPGYNYHQQHQECPLQAQRYNPQSLYQHQQLLQQQQLPYHLQYPAIMQPPHGSSTTWPVASNNEISGFLQQTPGHTSTCSFYPPQSSSAMAVMQTAPPSALNNAESDHLQEMFILEQQVQQVRQQQQQVRQQQQQIQQQVQQDQFQQQQQQQQQVQHQEDPQLEVQQQPVQQQQQQQQVRDQMVPRCQSIYAQQTASTVLLQNEFKR